LRSYRKAVNTAIAVLNKEKKLMKNIKIAPSILSADFSKMGEEVRSLQECGADLVHCDVMDGVFVNNITFGIKMVEDLRKITTLPLDCHLMIVHPEKYVERFAKAGADIITVHFEACQDNLKEVLLQIKGAGAKCGAVINPDTPVEKIAEVIPMCDMVLVMSVFPGFGGQKFIPEALNKLRQVKAIVDACGKDIDIEIDGGVGEDNVAIIKEAGANVIVAGSAVFKSQNRKETIAKLKA
jgi:ribulose-phosphate 3-epimerase